MYDDHQVVKKALSDSLMTWTRVAGTGTEGSYSTTCKEIPEIRRNR
jgi:hypothetical protein